MDIYIWPLSELILELSASFISIIKVMRPLYSVPDVDNQLFITYHPNYKEKLGMIEFTHNLFFFQPPSTQILPSSASSDSIAKVMKPMYNIPKASTT